MRNGQVRVRGAAEQGLAAGYLTDLPDEKRFAEEIEKTRPEIEARRRPREEQVVEGPPVWETSRWGFFRHPGVPGVPNRYPTVPFRYYPRQ